MTTLDTTVPSFSAFQLPECLNRAIKDMGFQAPTPIQVEAIPMGLTKRDVIGCAQTGTGKTAAFLIPLLFHILKNHRKGALVIVPTRELASQVAEVLRKLTKYAPQIKSAVVIGGVPMPGQIKLLARSPQVIIATPGRLVDHLRRGTVSLRATEFLVLDEADRILDMGFAPQLNELMRFVPGARQTFLFSATMAPAIEKLAHKYMKGPVRIDIGHEEPVEKIEQHAIHVTSAGKKEKLREELKSRAGTVLVFARTKSRADSVCKFLVGAGHSAGRIHGGRTQGQRAKTLEGFKNGQFQILVATDLVSRGIDVANIAHVINFDLPRCPEDYIHRIGRTARAGARGKALSLVAPEEKVFWKQISHFVNAKI